MSGARAAEPVGSLATALAHTARLLERDPALAEAQAREILKVVPNQADALLLLGSALGALGRSGPAVEAMGRAVSLNPRFTHAWRELGDRLTMAGETEAADAAYARHIKASTKDPALLEAATALCDGRLAVAERMLRDFLKAHPTDVAAIRMLAEVGARLGRYEDAEALLERCLELAPGFTTARHNYATVLHRLAKEPEAMAQLDLLMADDPGNPGYRTLRAACLARMGEYEQAVVEYETLLKAYARHPKAWMSYGHALKTLGRQADSIDAYRRSIALLPSLGEAYWSLANLKTVRFAPAEMEAMQDQLARSDISEEDRFHLHFALGKALEDAGDNAESFHHYRRGAELRRLSVGYDADETSDHVRRSRALLTPAFFAQRAGQGSPAPDPIFIVGLPRAGSTLIEQMLSSHSQVEGTMELPDIGAMARRLGERKRRSQVSLYPEVLAELEPDELRELGEAYLANTWIQRKLGRPLFIDKMPNNFSHIGLIQLILPNAKIIDARRHPLGGGFSCFKQHFARGQHFTYDLTELGRYYADYVELMAHFDAVLPGKVHRVIYERMIEDPEREVRRLLDYCGLAFEPACLKFYENERAVRTASSEQVRTPIFTESVDHWRNYEPWLGPLKAALGPVLDAYPDVPEFA